MSNELIKRLRDPAAEVEETVVPVEVVRLCVEAADAIETSTLEWGEAMKCGVVAAGVAQDYFERMQSAEARAERAETTVARLKGMLTYILTQAKTRPSGCNLTLSVIERNAAAALNDGFQAAVAALAQKDAAP